MSMDPSVSLEDLERVSERNITVKDQAEINSNIIHVCSAASSSQLSAESFADAAAATAAGNGLGGDGRNQRDIQSQA